jgi:thiol-disulfide isomerase/thioredoxin
MLTLRRLPALLSTSTRTLSKNRRNLVQVVTAAKQVVRIFVLLSREKREKRLLIHIPVIVRRCYECQGSRCCLLHRGMCTRRALSNYRASQSISKWPETLINGVLMCRSEDTDTVVKTCLVARTVISTIARSIYALNKTHCIVKGDSRYKWPSQAWCPPCKMISPAYDALSEEHKDVTFLKVKGVQVCHMVAGSLGQHRFRDAMATFWECYGTLSDLTSWHLMPGSAGLTNECCVWQSCQLRILTGDCETDDSWVQTDGCRLQTVAHRPIAYCRLVYGLTAYCLQFVYAGCCVECLAFWS